VPAYLATYSLKKPPAEVASFSSDQMCNVSLGAFLVAPWLT
jgi:hypothetical protein